MLRQNLSMRYFIFRDNKFHLDYSFDSKADGRLISRLLPADEAILDGFSDGTYVFPIQYRYVNEIVGGGFDSSRFIHKG